MKIKNINYITWKFLLDFPLHLSRMASPLALWYNGHFLAINFLLILRWVKSFEKYRNSSSAIRLIRIPDRISIRAIMLSTFQDKIATKILLNMNSCCAWAEFSQHFHFPVKKIQTDCYLQGTSVSVLVSTRPIVNLCAHTQCTSHHLYPSDIYGLWHLHTQFGAC